MPSILTKILHRKSRSGSASASQSGSRPSSTHSSPDLSLEDSSNLDPRSRQSLPTRTGTDPAVGSPARRSLDAPSSPARRRDVIVNHSRPAPPPPDSEAVVIDSRAGAKVATGPSSQSGASAKPAQHHPDDWAQRSFAPSSQGHESNAHPDLYTPLPNLNLDVNRELPPLPHTQSTPSHEVKAVEGWRDRPTMSSAHLRQSIEGELGRHSSDMIQRLTETSTSEGQHHAPQTERTITEEPSQSPDNGQSSLSGRAVEIPARGASLNPSQADSKLDDQMAKLSMQEGSERNKNTPQGAETLEGLRSDMAQQLFEESTNRREAREKLSEQGLETFNKAGMSELVGKEDTVDVHTKWMRPVVHETIIPKVHTEYTTIIEQEIHHHHVYPKIQPIEDPDPMILPPLHRIFSPQTGKWHEVEGDEAAIEILGEDVFRNGPKETRHVRQPYDEEAVAKQERTTSSPLTEVVGGIPEDDLTAQGFGTGGKGRVVEREGILGEKLGDWKDVARGDFFGHHHEDKENDTSIGVAK